MNIPAVILATPHDGDFLNTILPDVADPQVVCDWIETEPPRLAESVRPDFRTCVGTIAERIVRRDRVGETGVSVVHVYAQDLAKVCGQILAVALRVLLWAGIAHRDVQETIRAEPDAPAAMILGCARDFPQAARWLTGVS